MILTPHILTGALIGAQTTNPVAALFFGFVSHYLIDKIPHWDYDIKKIEEKSESNEAIKQWLKIGVDLLLPVFIVGYFAPNEEILKLSLLGAAAAALPDFLILLCWRTPLKSLNKHKTFHDSNHSKIKLGLVSGLVLYIIVAILFFWLYPVIYPG